MFQDHNIAVVIPAYKVETHICRVLSSIPKYVDQIIVVEDKSPDNTADVVSSFKDSRVTLIRHEKNTGVGGALKTGYKHALSSGADIIVKIDGDDQMDISYLPALLYPLVKNECDYTKGNRFSLLASNEAMPLIRKVGSQALTFLTKIASGYWHIFDPQNGYLAIRADTLRKLKLEWLDNTYFFENSMLINLNVIEARVSDVYIPSRYTDEPSSLRIFWVLRKFPPKLIRGFFFRIFYRYFYRDLSPVFILLAAGSVLMSIGCLIGGIAWYRSFFLNHPAPFGTIALGLVPIILGFQLLLNSLMLDIQQSPCGTKKVYDFSLHELSKVIYEAE